ncbi:MAG: tRNA pseudouridine(55) synthase TruB [Acidimicrobiia bacterium]|nr:tRNA pseudouridine(55) synthase TruB [Acidimicrobiia bacterium]
MARRRPATTHGVAVVDKPAGVTSHDVVGMLRRRFDERQVGHAGTLDPDATGVLVVAVGMATKLLRFVEKTSKRYVGEVVLGIETDTLDAAGKVTARHDMSGVSIADVERVVAEHLTGAIEQIPPMVSAIRIDGKRLHELAREGIEVERDPRPCTIRRFDVGATDEPGVYAIDVGCSAGTYIRTLAADLGTLLGGGAHLRALRRTAVGSFTIAESAPPDRCELLPVETAVRHLDRVEVDAATAALVANGRVLPTWVGDGPWSVYAPDGVLLSVYAAFRAGEAKPAVVLPTAQAWLAQPR